VRSSDLSARGSGGSSCAQRQQTSAPDQLTGNSNSGRALYTGHARLWQGDSVMEADSIELLEDRTCDERRGERAGGFSASAEKQQLRFLHASHPDKAGDYVAHAVCEDDLLGSRKSRAAGAERVVQSADEK